MLSTEFEGSLNCPSSSNTSPSTSWEGPGIPLWLATAMPMIRRPWRHLETRHSTSISPPPVGILRATVTFGVGALRCCESACLAASKRRRLCSSLMHRLWSLMLSESSQKYEEISPNDSGESNSCQFSSTAKVTSCDASTNWTVPLMRARDSTTRDMMIAENVMLFAHTSKIEKNRTCSAHVLTTPVHLPKTQRGKPVQMTRLINRN
mmetsp:Transcript_106833/g.297410  ORF Transcript_106833/g.297410 Transcript_106833/m.297410 type:complete len:207 (+) Transcript_106833:820-1440(+)